jgi:RNA-directed DNA polymerase
MSGTLRLGNISTRLRRIAKLAREDRHRVLTSLAHHIDEYFLGEAFARIRKDGAPGVDGQTARDYAENLGANLRSLLSRLKSGSYKAPPVLRAYIPKDGGKPRPIGIPTLEDKILQRAVTMVLEAIYEEEFLLCSYGFRPRRSAHQALKAFRDGMMSMKGGWVYEVDIQNFFGELVFAHLRSFLDLRVRDGVLRRAIDKWLKAGVMEDGVVHHPEKGTPQGGVISPLLANLYLHEVLDKWFETVVKPRLKGKAFLVRYADDFVIVFAEEADARRVASVLPKRLGRYGLSLHPEKTRLVRFERPPRGPLPPWEISPETFVFLGFTHFWARSRRGNWVVKRKTAPGRISRTLRTIGEWCRKHRHYPLRWQHQKLSAKLRGHYAYFGIKGNSDALAAVYWFVCRAWQRALKRRSNRRRLRWKKFLRRVLHNYPLPSPRIVHHRV